MEKETSVTIGRMVRSEIAESGKDPAIILLLTKKVDDLEKQLAAWKKFAQDLKDQGDMSLIRHTSEVARHNWNLAKLEEPKW